MSLRRIFLTFLMLINSWLIAEITGDISVAAIRVHFVSDDSPGTTGTGNFLIYSDTLLCNVNTIDPPPHDRPYFESQLIAVDNYFRTVSHNNFGIDMNTSEVFPLNINESYELPNEMSYYNPFDGDVDQEQRLTELFHDAVVAAHAADQLDFNNFDLVIIFHAGVGQDFNFPFIDPTPEDIPSTSIDSDMLLTHLGSVSIDLGNSKVSSGIILPETQNHLLFSEMNEVFSQIGDPCDFQFGLTGSLALQIGYSIGLPPLWDTKNGTSKIGVFGLMDQGSNNGFGVIPAAPEAWTRIYAGWESAQEVESPGNVLIGSFPDGKSKKVSITNSEYFLIENRTNWFRDKVDLDSALFVANVEHNKDLSKIDMIFDSIGAVLDENGVFTQIPDYDIGLPASGLLIWHIDESQIGMRIDENSINNDPHIKGLDLEEADGAQDLGFSSDFLFADPSQGYFADMWFQGNPEYERLYPNNKDKTLEFTSLTWPNTNSNSGANSHLSIYGIGYASDTMRFSVDNSLKVPGLPTALLNILFQYDFDNDGNVETFGGRDSLWWAEDDLNDRNYFHISDIDDQVLLVTNYNNVNPTLALVQDFGENLQIDLFKLVNNVFIKIDENILELNEIPKYMRGVPDSDEIIINDGPQCISWMNASGIYSGSAAIGPQGQVIINNQITLVETNPFKFLSAIDLDLNGSVEILAVDDRGFIYAYNDNGISVPGFPVSGTSATPVLCKNLSNDQFPELVYQSRTGDILVLNNKGDQLYKIANSIQNSLVGLGIYQANNVILTSSAIYRFEELDSTASNEWSYPVHDPSNSGVLVISSVEAPIDDKLFDKEKTYSYPNPARNENVIFRVEAHNAEKIDIKIYDLAGYFIEKISSVNIVKNRPNEIIWQTKEIESGIYFAKVTVTAGNRKEIKIIKIGVLN